MSAQITAMIEDCDPYCSLCGRDCNPYDFNEVAGEFICQACVEAMIDARAFEPRAEVGMVGTGGCR